MRFLPIVGRELRWAARNRGIRRVRWWATLLAMLIGALSLSALAATRAGNQIGNPFFNVLTGYAFGLCFLAGIGLTADSISSEKRDGTLGLLFLSELKGYDVVLGKFFPNFLSAFYILLALLPITALPLLFGGVTNAEFWRRALALICMLLVSLASGTVISAFLRDAQRAMVLTLGLVLLLVAGLPGLVALSSQTHLQAWFVWLHWLSPFYAYDYSVDRLYSRHRPVYWNSLLGSLLLTASFLLVAGKALSFSWRDGWLGPGSMGASGGIRALLRLGGRASPFRNRMPIPRHGVLKHPVSWLMQVKFGRPWGAWAVVLVWGITVLTVFLRHPSSASAIMLSHYGVAPFGFVLKALFALQACKFFSENRRNGNLELLLCTPLTNREIVRGVALGLWSSFSRPLAAFLVLLFAPLGAQFATSFYSHQVDPALGALGGSILGGIYTVRMLMDLLAVCWFGMGLALSMKKPQLASALTILYVLVLPSVLSACFLDIVPDVFFIVWGTAKTRTDLRYLLVQQHGMQ